MFKNKKIILFIVLIFFSLGKVNSAITDSLFMTVGNKPITQSDIINEIKILLILNNESYTEAKRDKLQKLAIQSLIKRNIKKIEIEKLNVIEFNIVDLENELKRFASGMNVDVDTLKNICASNELDFSLIEDLIKVELRWNTLVFATYKNRLIVNSSDIDEELKKLEKIKKNEYLISEILMPISNSDEVADVTNNLKKKIEIEGFESVAEQLSIAESSLKGGDLGWLDENIISEKIKPAIMKTQIGKISEAIILPEGILIFKVRDKREIKSDLTLEDKKNKLVVAEKNKILGMYSLSHYDKVRRSIAIKFINE
jgi:peptidyl-prolyl cis-trans isomerase SurA